MSYGEFFLYITAGAFWGIVGFTNGRNLYRRWKAPRQMSKLDDMISRLKQEAQEAMEAMKIEIKQTPSTPETHVLSWRYKGELQQVKIVIDPALDTAIEGSREEFEQLVKEGDAGKLQDLLDGLASNDAKDRISAQDIFVFSRKAVEQMKMADMSPDDIVTKILKASGRMD
jgi:hypothetical protein